MFISCLTPETKQKLITPIALNFVEQKTGHKLDPNTNEKITDGARGVYEKTTGYVAL